MGNDDLTIKERVQWFLDGGYMLMVGGRLAITSKLEKELGITVPEELSQKQISNELVKPTTYTTDLKAIWNKFIEDAQIPHRVRSPNGSIYTVRQYGSAVAKKLAIIIGRLDIDYTRLVESTKNYYRTVSYKSLLSNYIDQDIWYHEYTSWGEVKKNEVDGGNRWERE